MMGQFRQIIPSPGTGTPPKMRLMRSRLEAPLGARTQISTVCSHLVISPRCKALSVQIDQQLPRLHLVNRLIDLIVVRVHVDVRAHRIDGSQRRRQLRDVGQRIRHRVREIDEVHHRVTAC